MAEMEHRHDPDGAIIALIKSIEVAAKERDAVMKLEMERMTETHDDLRQMAANIAHVFGPDGDFARVATDVTRHNKWEGRIRDGGMWLGKVILLIVGIFGTGTLANWMRKVVGMAPAANK